MSSSYPEIPHHDVPATSDDARVRKRRRRTMACTQCRSRKLRCDREYPICGRCQKGKNPAQCTYENGFLWQQPNTVPATTVFSGANNAGGGGGDGAPGGPTTIASTTTTTAIPPVPQVPGVDTEPNALYNGNANVHANNATTLPRVADRTPVHTPPDSTGSAITSTWGGGPRTQTSGTEGGRCEGKKDRFLETVLGAPKAAVNQDSYVHTDVFQRHPGGASLPGYYPHHPHYPSHQHHHYQHHQHHDLYPNYPQANTDEDGGMASPSQQLDLSPRIMMRGKDTRTRFNGSGILANVMAQFPDIKSFAEDIRVSSPHMAQLRPDLERVKRGLWKKVPLNTPFPVPDTMALILLLPSRRVVDDLVVLYLTYIESTHRILHVPSFLRELDHFWAQRQSPDFVSPAFAVQLLLVLACAWNLADPDALKSKSEDSLKCYTAIEWVLHAEKWLENTTIKRPEITALRLYVLLILARNSHGMERSQAWLATGTLVKQAMLAGYHRDPDHHSKISVFHKEMRRRIWTTIVELDLQVALDRGMPPSVQVSDYDTEPGLNINDNELQDTMAELPAGRPITELTDCSFQTALSHSLPLRLKICKLMHSPRISCHYDEILRMDWELGKHLSKIPTWSSSDADDLQTQHKVVLLKALLETKIGHCLLSLHTPFAIVAYKEPLFIPSSRARMEVAAMLLSTQRRLHETARPLSLCNTGDWTMQAFCSICQLLHASAGETNSNSGSTTLLTRTLLGFPEALVSLAEAILMCLEARLLLVVKGAKEYFFMSTIIALVKTKLWPAQGNIFKQEVIDRVVMFAQTLFTRHATCAHLGPLGMGCFQTNQLPTLTPGPPLVSTLAPQLAPSFNGMLPANLGIAQPGEFDPFLDVFDFEDLTGITLE